MSATAKVRRLPTPEEYGRVLAERQKRRLAQARTNKTNTRRIEEIHKRTAELEEINQTLRDALAKANGLLDRLEALPEPAPERGRVIEHGVVTVEIESRDANGDIKSAVVRPQRH